VAERAQRLVGAAKKLPLPEGTYAMGAGLLILGATAYGFQVLAAKELSKSNYSAVNILWTLVYVATPGLFQPLEQEVARALSHRRARGLGGGPLIKRAATLGGVLAAGVVVGALAAYVPIVDNLFNGQGSLMIGLIVAIVCYYAAYITRGSLSGNGRFKPYGVMLGSEGTTRITFCILLFIAAAKSPGWWGLAVGLPPIFAVLIALRGQRDLVTPGPDAPYSELSGALAWLLVGSVFAQALSYISVLGVQLQATPAQRRFITAGFITGVFVARIPLLMFQAIQAALLPKLARHASEGKHEDFRTGMLRLVALVGALGVVGTIGATILGPTVGKKLFPSKWDLDSRDMFLLTAAMMIFILALTIAQGLIALKRYRVNAVAWIAGVVAFIAVDVSLTHTSLFLRNEISLLVGTIVSAVLAGIFLLTFMRRGALALEDLVEVVEHEPLEI
jgi:O-antigen/teichoic acid export membrane protein